MPVKSAGDPVLPKIEACKIAHAAFEASCEGEPRCHAPEHKAWSDRQHAAGDVYENKLFDLVETQATTRQGITQMLDMYLEYERGLIRENELALLENIQRYLHASA